MISTPIAAAIGGLAGSAITGIISYYNTKKQEDRQDQRSVAEFYLENKVETLTELHENFSEVHSILMAYKKPSGESETSGFDLEATQEQLERVNKLTRNIRTLIVKSGLYVSKAQKEKLTLGLMAVNYAIADVNPEGELNSGMLQKVREIGKNIDEEAEIGDYYKSIEDTLNVLEKEINEPIRKIRG